MEKTLLKTEVLRQGMNIEENLAQCISKLQGGCFTLKRLLPRSVAGSITFRRL